MELSTTMTCSIVLKKTPATLSLVSCSWDPWTNIFQTYSRSPTMRRLSDSTEPPADFSTSSAARADSKPYSNVPVAVSYRWKQDKNGKNLITELKYDYILCCKPKVLINLLLHYAKYQYHYALLYRVIPLLLKYVITWGEPGIKI